MGYYYFKCKSITYAQRVSKFLLGKGITAGVVKLPLKYTSEGCGYSIKISESKFEKVKKLLDEAQLETVKVYYSANNSEFKEVAL